MKVKSESEVVQSCPTLSDPMDRSLPGSSAHGIFQVRVLEWGAIAFSHSLHITAVNRIQAMRCLPQRIFRVVSALYNSVQFSSVAQSCPTLCSPMDYSLPGSSIHGILQARVLEWVAISFSRGIFPTQGSNPGLLHCRQTLYHLSHQGSLSAELLSFAYP